MEAGLVLSLERVGPSPAGLTDRRGVRRKTSLHLGQLTRELQDHHRRQQREAGDVSDSFKKAGGGRGDLPYGLSSVSPGSQAARQQAARQQAARQAGDASLI